MTDLSREINALVESHGPAAILAALAQRIREEAAIAHGEEADEGQPRLATRWAALAEQVQAAADDCRANLGGEDEPVIEAPKEDGCFYCGGTGPCECYSN